MESLLIKLRGLWVGLALSELYVVRQASERGTHPLPKTHTLSQRAEGWLQASEPEIQSFLLKEMRSHNLLLDVLPLAFLHPTGIPGLQKQLQYCLDHTDHHETLAQAITIVETLAELMSPSDMAPESLPFSKTLDDFQLTVQRMTVIGHPLEMTMLGGALSGFKHSLRGLPLSWRLKLRTLQWTEGQSCEDELCRLSDRCLAQWAGCYGTGRSDGLVGVAIGPAWQRTNGGSGSFPKLA